MLFLDRLTLDAPKRTKEGFLAVRARAARTGIYDYLGMELDREGKHFEPNQIVKVYRPPEEVFSRDAVHSFLLKPITDDHPSVPVTADNWKHHARGVAAGAMRDGDFLAFDLVLMDKAAIEAVDSGKKQLSNGYSSTLDLTPGEIDGQHYDCVQRNIRGNHIALVAAGRAGPDCRISDAPVCDSISTDVLERLLADSQTYRAENSGDNLHTSGTGAFAMNTITIDGIPFEMNDQAIAAVRQLQGKLSDEQQARAKADTSVAALTADIANRDAEIVTLKKQLEDSKLSPQALRDAAKAYAVTVDKAKALGVSVTDEMDEAAIIKACVLAKVGDAAKDWTPEQFAAGFAILDAKSGGAKPVDSVRQALTDGSVVISDTAAIRENARTARYERN